MKSFLKSRSIRDFWSPCGRWRLSPRHLTVSSSFLLTIFRRKCSVNIYADGTSVYWCTSKNLNDQKLTAGISSDLTQGKTNITSDNSKTKPVTFNHYQTDPERSVTPMSVSYLKEDHCLEYLLRITPNFKWTLHLPTLRQQVWERVDNYWARPRNLFLCLIIQSDFGKMIGPRTFLYPLQRQMTKNACFGIRLEELYFSDHVSVLRILLIVIQ